MDHYQVIEATWLQTVWVSYYNDMSRIAIFLFEIEALRHAMANPNSRVKSVMLPCADILVALRAS